ncbi:MarR family transcriptional regulator [Natronomonas gomsonensis]|uniref:MarR family transcriptional regulator n=1 Tax=Natronomonas gomsonensis TaxID=1046043 RepID=UPI0020CA47BE|nr:MarR family transcriptional regulator [Natronomonas gomsonensis]MCY4730532.1 MarR family transcriptional regulator [Natronomonas gomsonensis]
MGQYEVAKLILDSDAGLEKSQLVRQIDLSKSAIEASINDLLEKDYITKTEDGRLIWNPDIPEEKIESIRPRSFSELDF